MDTKKQKRRGPGALDVFIVLALIAVIAVLMYPKMKSYDLSFLCRVVKSD